MKATKNVEKKLWFWSCKRCDGWRRRTESWSGGEEQWRLRVQKRFSAFRMESIWKIEDRARIMKIKRDERENHFTFFFHFFVNNYEDSYSNWITSTLLEETIKPPTKSSNLFSPKQTVIDIKIWYFASYQSISWISTNRISIKQIDFHLKLKFV